MMLALPAETWIRLGIWLAIGMVVYFGYGRHHSRVQKALKTSQDSPR
jgi:APA family basic amino acid/polyamine antiporter